MDAISCIASMSASATSSLRVPSKVKGRVKPTPTKNPQRRNWLTTWSICTPGPADAEKSEPWWPSGARGRSCMKQVPGEVTHAAQAGCCGRMHFPLAWMPPHQLPIPTFTQSMLSRALIGTHQRCAARTTERRPQHERCAHIGRASGQWLATQRVQVIVTQHSVVAGCSNVNAAHA
eukprot:366226-Chlamydomonas_euryale.AAC.10